MCLRRSRPIFLRMIITIFALFFAATTAPQTDFIQAIRAQDAAKVQSMLEADPSLANAKSEKGRSAVTLAMFALVNKEGFMRPANNPLLKLLLARHPKLDLWETAALGTPAELTQLLKGDRKSR